jgi:hypothetical protein
MDAMTMDLETMQKTIESWNKNHQIEILKIIKKSSASLINENKSGIYINMSFLPKDTVNEICNYIHYVKHLEEITLKPFETQKEDIKSTFFTDK